MNDLISPVVRKYLKGDFLWATMHLYPAAVVYLTALTVKPAMENLGPYKSLIRLNRIKHLWLTYSPPFYWVYLSLAAALKIGERLIPKIDQAAKRYPWADQYTLFPGPNSNTFPAWIGQQIPELGLKMPFKAFGSGYAD